MSFTGELTLKDRATMAMRATYLITIFLPFIFLGPLLLFLADLLLKWSQDSKVQINGHRYPLLHPASCSSMGKIPCFQSLVGTMTPESHVRCLLQPADLAPGRESDRRAQAVLIACLAARLAMLRAPLALILHLLEA